MDRAVATYGLHFFPDPGSCLLNGNIGTRIAQIVDRVSVLFEGFLQVFHGQRDVGDAVEEDNDLLSQGYSGKNTYYR